jgi:hypothetical protein
LLLVSRHVLSSLLSSHSSFPPALKAGTYRAPKATLAATWWRAKVFWELRRRLSRTSGPPACLILRR